MTATATAPRTAPGPDEPASSPDPGGARALLVWAVLALLLAVAVPLAPVTVSDPVVTWPRSGELPASTTLPLTPPRPASFDLVLPCAALTGAGPAEVLATVPAGAPEGGLGLRATLTGDGAARRLDVVTAGTPLLSAPVAGLPGGCTIGLRIGAAGASATLDGAPLPLVCGDCAGVEPPQVARLATTLAPAAAAGLAVTLHPDDRYASTPTPLKGVLLLAQLVALAVLAALLVRGRPGRDRDPEVRRRGLRAGRDALARVGARVAGRVRRHGSPADVVVVAVSAVWVLLSPMNYDDSWYPLMARGAGPVGR